MVREKLKLKPETKALFQIIISIALMFIVLFIVNKASVENLKKYGYFGVFFINLLSSATVLIPVPGFLVVSIFAFKLNPILLGISAGVGSAIGEFNGYLIGKGSSTLTKDKKAKLLYKLTLKSKKIANILYVFENIFSKNLFLMIFFFSLIPNPFFDIAGIIAGYSGMKPRSFLFACALGKSLRMIFFAVFGSSLHSFLV